MPGPGISVPQHHNKRSSPSADEALPTHQTLPQCATLLADTEKDSLMAIHTAVVATAKRAMKDNKVLGDHPPPISGEETNKTTEDNALTNPFGTLQTTSLLQE